MAAVLTIDFKNLTFPMVPLKAFLCTLPKMTCSTGSELRKSVMRMTSSESVLFASKLETN